MIQTIDEIYEEAKYVIPPKKLKEYVETQRKYTKEDFDNIIQKKERLILERNAELFPDGTSAKALDLYHVYNTLKKPIAESKSQKAIGNEYMKSVRQRPKTAFKNPQISFKKHNLRILEYTDSEENNEEGDNLEEVKMLGSETIFDEDQKQLNIVKQSKLHLFLS